MDNKKYKNFLWLNRGELVSPHLVMANWEGNVEKASLEN